MADEGDSKSLVGNNVRVRVPPPASLAGAYGPLSCEIFSWLGGLSFWTKSLPWDGNMTGLGKGPL